MENIVFDNIVFSLQRSGGISVVWRDLLAEAGRSESCRWLEYSDPMKNLMRSGLDPGDATVEFPSAWPVFIERYCEARYALDEPHVFHSSYYRLSACRSARTVVTVHDFTYERLMSSLRREIHSRQKRRAILAADVIVCISESTRRDLLHFIPDVDVSRVTVIPNGVSDRFFRKDESPLPHLGDHALFVGARDGYKNFRVAVEGIARTDLKLTICGKKLSRSEQALLDSQLPGRWNLIEMPEDSELNDIYNSCFALVYPSENEGFGLPVAEAQKVGLPVVALRASSIPEITGNIATLINAPEPKQITNRLDALRSDRFRSIVIDQGLVQARNYTTKATAEGYKAVYSSLK